VTVYRAAAVIAVALLAASCASVVDGTTQPISIVTTPVSGALCICSNDRGQWSVVTPGSIVIAKSESILQIRCSKRGYLDGTLYAAGHMTSAGLAGLLVRYLSLLNAAVDASTGAALSYPDSYNIELKSTDAANQGVTTGAGSVGTADVGPSTPTHSN